MVISSSDEAAYAVTVKKPGAITTSGAEVLKSTPATKATHKQAAIVPRLIHLDDNPFAFFVAL
jgi:hypothetical protein